LKACIEGALLGGRPANIVVDGKKIASVGKEKDRSGEVIDGKGLAIIPGFVNAHTHAAMSLLRGFSDDYPLQEWLQKYIWPTEAKLQPKDAYWGAKLACLEMAKGGTTSFCDMYFHSEETAKAAKETGIRGFLSEVFIGREGIQIEKTFAHLEKLKKFHELVTPVLGPHALYTVNEEFLRKIAEKSEKENIPVHFHLSETKKEVEDCIKEHGKKPVEYLESIGFLSERVLNAHAVWLDKKEISILARSGAKAVHCPVSNMKLAVGNAMDYNALKKAGVTVALGTDGCASNNSLSMLEEMKFAALLQKHHFSDTTRLPAAEAFGMATESGAKALGLECGKIEEERPADFSLVNLKNIGLIPGHSLVSDLVYSANDSCIDTVFCNGEIVVRNGKAEGEEEILEKAREQALDWVSR